MTVYEDAFHVDDITIATLLHRIEERARHGERPRVASLPGEKLGYPRLLCLDMNKWICLARAHYDRPDGQIFKAALTSIRSAVDSGALVVPIAAANAREAMAARDEARRRRLAEFMVSLSGNHSIANDVDVVLPEMDNAVSMLWRKSPPRHSVRTRLVQRGLIAAIEGKELTITGLDEPMKTVFTDFAHEPELSVLMLMHARTREDVALSRERDLETASTSMKTRATQRRMTLDEAKRIETRSLFSGGLALDQLRTILASVGDDQASFLEWLSDDDNAARFARSIPGIDVMSELLLRRNRNPSHTSHRNDAEDLSFLRLAIPYANIVVVEKAWGHYIQASAVAGRYNTVVISDLTHLPDLLQATLQ